MSLSVAATPALPVKTFGERCASSPAVPAFDPPDDGGRCELCSEHAAAPSDAATAQRVSARNV
jgi:hypothetical protein